MYGVTTYENLGASRSMMIQILRRGQIPEGWVGTDRVVVGVFPCPQGGPEGGKIEVAVVSGHHILNFFIELFRILFC